MAVIRLSSCGKTQLVADLTVNHRQFFRPNFDCITNIFQHWQPVYDDISSKLNDRDISFLNGVDWNQMAAMSNLQRHLLVSDDVFDELGNSLLFKPRWLRSSQKSTGNNLYQRGPHKDNRHEPYSLTAVEKPTRHNTN